MDGYNPLFDASAPSTPAGLAPALGDSAITGVPVTGTGLVGAVYAPERSINSIDALKEVIAAGAPDLTFVATELSYYGKRSDTTVAQFLDEDAASLSGDGSLFEMGPSGLSMSGYIYIPAGVHEISVYSDDGFELTLGGVPFSDFQGGRSADETARVAEFAGGLYEIDALYFDKGGAQAFTLLIDGMPVDQSALYQSVDDFQNPPAGTALVPVEEYHPAYFLGEAVIDTPETETGGSGSDLMEGLGGDDVLDGAEGDDVIYGGYGDDSLEGGDGNDLIDGGRGSDIAYGGDGDDTLVVRSDAGEQRIGQLAIGEPTRGDPDNEVNEELQKLKGYEGQPLLSDDILFGGAGKDTFAILPQLNGKLEIIEKHVRSDGTINWAGVAGENNELHDHWTDHTGNIIIGDYDADEDHIAVIGHTANVYVEYDDVDGDGDEESLITVISQQHGGGGAHTQDLLAQVVVFGDRVDEDDIQTDDGVTYGVVESYDDVAEAIFPVGEVKTTDIDGVTYHGYDSRGPNGELGPITSDPYGNFENDWLAEAEFADPSSEEEVELTRYPFEQLGTTDAAGQTSSGTDGDDTIAPVHAETETGLPGALSFYSFAGTDGAYRGRARRDDGAGLHALREHGDPAHRRRHHGP